MILSTMLNNMKTWEYILVTKKENDYKECTVFDNYDIYDILTDYLAEGKHLYKLEENENKMALKKDNGEINFRKLEEHEILAFYPNKASKEHYAILHFNAKGETIYLDKDVEKSMRKAKEVDPFLKDSTLKDEIFSWVMMNNLIECKKMYMWVRNQGEEVCTVYTKDVGKVLEKLEKMASV